MKTHWGALAAALALAAPAYAEDTMFVPLFTYRTGAFAPTGGPVADGMHDYLEMLNQRDGGVGGVKLVIEECETAYDTKKGLECYEQVKPKNPVMVNPWSTGITLSLIPRASVDKIPILSMAYGLSAAARGDIFPWVFNPPNTYWDGGSAILKYIGGGSVDGLKGKRIGYIYLDAAFGREALAFFQAESRRVGFDLKLYPIAPADVQNQSSKWLDIRRDKPEFLIMYGNGALNPTAIKEAVKANFPMDHFVSIWWPNNADAASGGEGAKGFRELNWHGPGADYPAFDAIKKLVIDAGKSQTPPEEFGTSTYDHGVYNSMLIAEGIAQAQKATGKKQVDGEDVRRGLEALNLDPRRIKELGLTGFVTPFKLSCADHNSHGATFVQAWDGAKWEKASDLITPDLDQVQPLIDAAAKAYSEKAGGWPTRTEPCDAK